MKRDSTPRDRPRPTWLRLVATLVLSLVVVLCAIAVFA
jgi:hypothetical protein